jgi:hypothetical protein
MSKKGAIGPIFEGDMPFLKKMTPKWAPILAL